MMDGGGVRLAIEDDVSPDLEAAATGKEGRRAVGQNLDTHGAS